MKWSISKETLNKPTLRGKTTNFRYSFIFGNGYSPLSGEDSFFDLQKNDLPDKVGRSSVYSNFTRPNTR